MTRHAGGDTLEAELEAARTFQQSLLPPATSSIGVLEFAGSYRPCESLGGDLYDYVDAGAGRLTAIVADVSGHGVSAAMLTGIVKSAFHDSHAEDWEPAAVVRRVSAALKPFAADRFVTLFCARLDPARGRLEFVNAGHPAPFKRAADGGLRYLTPTGPLISPAFPDFGWECEVVPFRAGDQLLIYTDGLTEARNDGGLYGEDRLETLFRESEARGAALLSEICASVEIFTHGRPADDDRTLAAISYRL